MSRRSLAALALAASALTAVPVAQAATAGPAVRLHAGLRGFTATPLTFTVHVGPDGGTTCTIPGTLRVPDGVDARHPAPAAILSTNGFGGGKDDTGPNGNGSYGARFAEQGYVTLSYAGLGFGGSSCLIYVDDPQYDGRAGSQLISFLGGAKGIATRDGKPFDIAGLVRTKPRAHDGRSYPNDPYVGMIGGSYGGQVQFAVASVDPRLDTIVPVYTWNDLGYSLSPNNADPVARDQVRNGTPGVWKAAWHSLFFGLGAAGPVLYPGNSGSSCGGYTPWVCNAYAESVAGRFSDATLQHVRQVSVGYYVNRIRIPTLLSQGQQDSLFTLREAVATYRQLRARHVPVRMLWQSWGHTDENPVAGELDTGTLSPGSADLRDTYQGRIYTDWFAHWLKGVPNALGPNLRYFRDWAYTAPSAGASKADALTAATRAYGSASDPAALRATRLLLSGGNALVSRAPQPGSATFLSTGGAPSGSGEVVISAARPPQGQAPGSSAAWTGAPLASPLDVAGVPQLTVRLDAPVNAAAQSDLSGKLVVFGELDDVAPDGSLTVVRDLVAAARVPDVTKPVHLYLPGVVHRFAAGHSVRLVLAAGDASYKGSNLPGPVTITDGPLTPNALVLPTER